MNLKRVFVLAAVFVVFMSISAMAESKIGLGYQGMLGESDWWNGVSVRGWMDELGFDIGVVEEAYHDSYRSGSVSKDEEWMVQAQAMYAPEGLAGKNAKCYFGAGLGYGYYSYQSGSYSVRDNYFIAQPLFGIEYSFGEIPELGFNAQVGYTINLDKHDNVHDDSSDYNDHERYVDVGLGVHYYFD
jgi:hypothetical protein